MVRFGARNYDEEERRYERRYREKERKHKEYERERKCREFMEGPKYEKYLIREFLEDPEYVKYHEERRKRKEERKH